MTNTNSKVWLITGSSTGFGRTLAETILEKGERVIATARKPEQLKDFAKYPETALSLRLDVTNPDEIKTVIEKAIATFGRIDVLVNNAGYGVNTLILNSGKRLSL